MQTQNQDCNIVEQLLPETKGVRNLLGSLTQGWQQNPANYPVIVDAFNRCFLYGFRYIRSYMRAFIGLEDLRRAQRFYRMRILRFPGEGYQTVAAYDSAEWRISVAPGTLIWGIQLPTVPNPTFTPQNVQILIGATQQPVFNRLTSGIAFAQGQPLGANTNTVTAPGMFLNSVSLISPPIMVPDDGSVTVTLSNTTAANDMLLLLFAAEPKGDRIV